MDLALFETLASAELTDEQRATAARVAEQRWLSNPRENHLIGYVHFFGRPVELDSDAELLGFDQETIDVLNARILGLQSALLAYSS